MNGTFIRKAALPDLPYFYGICLKTTDSGKDGTRLYNDPYLIGHYYAAPYLLYPKGICFTVVHEHRPQGYIVSAPDTPAFHRWMEEQWLPPLRALFPQPFPKELIRSEAEEKAVSLVHRNLLDHGDRDGPLFRDYPAHLHIDLLPSVQGKGWGRRLMENLLAELSRAGVKGVHLGVNGENTGAAAFYRKTGFSVLREEQWGFTMGKPCQG